MRTIVLFSLLLISAVGGVGLAWAVISYDLPQLGFQANVPPAEFGSAEKVDDLSESKIELSAAPAFSPTVSPSPGFLPLEPPFQQQVDLEELTETIKKAKDDQNNLLEKQDRSWDTINKAIDSLREVATLKVQQAPPAVGNIAAPAPVAPTAVPPGIVSQNLNPAPPVAPIESTPRTQVTAAPSGETIPVPAEGKDEANREEGRRPRIIPEEGDDRLTIVIQDSDIREVLELLSDQGQLNILPSQSVQGRVSASLSKVDVRTALEAILRSTGYVMREDRGFIFVGTPADMDGMDRLHDRIGTRLYRLKYVRAIDVETLLTPLLTADVGTISVTQPSQVGISPDSSNSGSDDYAGEETVIVRDYEQVLAKIDRMMRDIDRRPLQVAIEAMILSVQLDDSFDLGVSFEALRQQNTIRVVSGVPPADLTSISLADGGLKLGYLDANFSMFVDALEKVGETNVIAAPQLLVLNKQKAEILIGEQKGYISTTVTESAATQSVEFLEVGTQLRIRPFITDDGMVRMEVHPEISTGDVRVEAGLTIPDKEVTQVTTNIMCPDGRTVVIGGLINSSQSKTNNQIPLLGSLPGAGLLFRSKSETLQRQELIVLITPRIVDPGHIPNDGEEARDLFELQHEISADKMSPLGKRHIGRKYYRLATAAWAVGDAIKALRYCNLSLHYDVQNLEAIHLRDTIIAETGVGDRSVHSHLKEGLYPWQHPSGVPVSPWHLDRVEELPFEEIYPPEPQSRVINPRVSTHHGHGK